MVLSALHSAVPSFELGVGRRLQAVLVVPRTQVRWIKVRWRFPWAYQALTCVPSWILLLNCMYQGDPADDREAHWLPMGTSDLLGKETGRNGFRNHLICAYQL